MVAIKDTKHRELSKSGAMSSGQLIESSLDQAVRRRIAACPYAFVFDKIHWDFHDEVLTLRGAVPSFYLKQVLQELLRDLGQIDRIVNEVHVVSSNGLSSAQPHQPR